MWQWFIRKTIEQLSADTGLLFQLKREVEDLHQKLAARQRSASVSERQDSVSSDRGDGSKEQVGNILFTWKIRNTPHLQLSLGFERGRVMLLLFVISHIYQKELLISDEILLFRWWRRKEVSHVIPQGPRHLPSSPPPQQEGEELEGKTRHQRGLMWKRRRVMRKQRSVFSKASLSYFHKIQQAPVRVIEHK